MKQQPNRRKAGGFVEGKGFYIVLFLCVAAIGISGYYLFSGLTRQPGGFGQEVISPKNGQVAVEDRQGGQTPSNPAVPQTGEDKKQDTNTAQPKADAKPSEDTAAAPKTEDAKSDEAPTATTFVWPVDGAVERDFSLEVFAYDTTMGDWRTHGGVDIAAELGAPVSACAAGTVTDVRSDDMMGYTVIVDHGRGIESVYANLAEGVEVQSGDTVEPGTHLGCVGTSAISESASPSHLHFEMMEYGVSVDPMNYLDE